MDFSLGFQCAFVLLISLMADNDMYREYSIAPPSSFNTILVDGFPVIFYEYLANSTGTLVLSIYRNAKWVLQTFLHKFSK